MWVMASFMRFLDHTQRLTTYSVELLWTEDQPVTETSTWQHTTLTTDRPSCQGGIRNHNLSRRSAADLSLRQCGHWDRLQADVMENLCTSDYASFIV